MSKITKKDRIAHLEFQVAWLTDAVHELQGTENLESEPQLKQLDQSIFNGLDEKWRFAAVDADGSANGFDVRVYPRGGDKYGLFAYADDYANSDDNSIRLGEGYDASNWQNSLIEREIAKELTGSDLARAMLERGDKYIVCTVDYGVVVITGSNKDGSFFSTDCAYTSATPINNQGEPLTAAEAGL